MTDLDNIAGLIEYRHTLVAYRPGVLRDHLQRGLKPANVLSGRVGVGARDSTPPVPLGPLRRCADGRPESPHPQPSLTALFGNLLRHRQEALEEREPRFRVVPDDRQRVDHDGAYGVEEQVVVH